MNDEQILRETVSDRLGRELPDTAWRRAYERAQRKLHHIVARYGDAGGARRTTDYMAQLVIEAIRAEAAEKETGADANAGPQGHTNILTQTRLKSQAIFG